MTKIDILSIINENNVNNEIIWNVEKNTQKEIIISNDYMGGVKFSIKIVENGTNEKDIKIVDETQKSIVTYLIQGNEFYCDFENQEVGIAQAVSKIVRYFYYLY